MTEPGRFDELPRPLAFVLGGGATLGALQVGMLTALGRAGVDPDMVVGTSVGALNGAVLADAGASAAAAELLRGTWLSMSTASVFPGSKVRQGWRLLRGRSVYPDTGLRGVVRDVLGPAPTFEGLTLPFAAVASDVLDGHPAAFAAGELTLPILASAAIPGLLPTQTIDGQPYWDGGVTSNIPLQSALAMGAASIVVLDAGDICHRSLPPDGAAASVLAAMGTAIRQRVLVEIAGVAARVPVLYIDRPCVTGRQPLSFASTPDLLARGEEHAAAFLATAPVPVAGTLVGAPHVHGDDGLLHDAAHRPVFVRGLPTR